MKILASILAVIAAAFGGVTYGAFNFVSSGTYTLAAPVDSTQTSIAVDNFLKPVSNTQYVMATDFGSIGYMTLEPGSVTKKEFISFTGFSYSGNRATLTGITRGLEFNYPYTASSSLRQSHSGAAKAIISNPPQLYNQLAVKQNNEWITGSWGFATAPTTTDACSSTGELCNYDFVVAQSIQGGATSTETNMGFVELATHAETAAGTASSSTQKPLVVPSKIANSTPGSCNAVACIPVAVAGKIAQGFLDLTASFTWTGQHTFANLFATNSTSTNATTTGTLGWGTASYLLPVAPSATSSVLVVSGVSPYRMQWAPAMRPYASVLTDGPASNAAGFSSTTMALSIPAGALTASSTIQVTLGGSCNDNGGSGGTCTFYLRNSCQRAPNFPRMWASNFP